MPQMSLRIGVTVVSVLLILIHQLAPAIKLDTATLVLIGVALLPWLQPIFKTVKLPGGIEVTLQDMKQEIQTAVGAAQSAERKAELAVSGIVTSPAADLPNAVRNEASPPSAQGLAALAREYEHIRATQRSGASRTNAMTTVVRKMIEHANDVAEQELPGLLKSGAAGDRLIAYASLYGHPRPELLQELTSSVASTENQPFGQYWGLQAISRNLPDQPRNVPSSVLATLSAFSSTIKAGTDRDYELSRILRQLRGG